MWIVLEKKSLRKILKKLPREVLVRYEAWKRIVELEGHEGLKLIKGFHDESLKGNWKGCRSSLLGIQWRIIYIENKNELNVFVIEINPHTY